MSSCYGGTLVFQEWNTIEMYSSKFPFLIVEIHRDYGCGNCKAMSPLLDKETKANRITFLKIECDKFRKIAANYNIRLLPGVILFINGVVRDKFEGYKPEALTRMINIAKAEMTGSPVSCPQLNTQPEPCSCSDGTCTINPCSGGTCIIGSNIDVCYNTYVEGIGFQSQTFKNGEIGGTVGQSRRLEAVKIFLANGANGGIRYSAHVQNVGWMNYVADGQIGGTTGRNQRLEAIIIELTGPISQTHDVYYRTHIQDNGWLTWAKNGEKSGSEGRDLRCEAIQVVILKKGETAQTNPKVFFGPNVDIPFIH